jgi:hypothetical protein
LPNLILKPCLFTNFFYFAIQPHLFFGTYDISPLQQQHHNSHLHHNTHNLSRLLHLLRPNDNLVWDFWPLYLHEGAQL